MKVIYATSIPPGLQGPTRGELRIRVQSMIIQDSLVNNSSETYTQGSFPHVPVDHCSIQFRFWGESATRMSSAVLPKTAAHPDRPTYEIVYTVKTLEAQLVQYLQHMTASNQGGLVADIFVSSDVSGKKNATNVGRAVISLAALTPSTSISGWFNVVDFATKSRCVGRVQLNISVAFFEPAAAIAVKKQRGPNGVAQKGADDITAAALLSEDSNRNGGGGDKKVAAATSPEPEAIVKDGPADGMARPAPSVSFPQQKPPGVPASSSPLTAAAPPVPEEELYSSALLRAKPGDASTDKSHRDILLRDIFERGVALRDRMAAASASSLGGDGLSSLPASLLAHQGPAANPTLSSVSSMLKKLPPNAPTAFSFAEHLHSNAPVSTRNDMLHSASDEADDVSTSTEESDDNRKANCGTKDLDQRGSEETQPRSQALVFVPQESTLQLTLSNISFSSLDRPVSEIRFGLRWSTDVCVSGLPLNTVSSFVRKLPLSRDCSIHLQLDVRSYTSESKLVLECYSVMSEAKPLPPRTTLLPSDQPPPQERIIVKEVLLGLAAFGVFSQTRDILLHDPVSGANPLRLTLSAAIVSQAENKNQGSGNATTSESHAVDSAHGPRFDISTYNANDELNKTREDMVKRLSNKERREGKRRGTADRRRQHHKEATSSSSRSDDDASETSSSISTTSSTNEDSDGHRRRGRGSKSKSFRGAHVVVFDPRGGPGGNAVGVSTVTITQNPPKSPMYQTLQSTQQTQKVEQPTVGGAVAAGGGQFQLGCKRVHVSIVEAKSLPQRLRFLHPSPSDEVGSHTYAWERAVEEQGAPARSKDETRGPTTFFVVEDFTLAASAVSPLLETAPPSSSGKRASSLTGGVVEGWTVEAAVQGKNDRTQVIVDNVSPQYKYECIAALPSHVSQLGQLHLTMWAVHGNCDEALRDDAAGKEDLFWSACAPVGRVVVDLTMLKFLPVVDGWNKILSVCHAVDTVIGHVRIAVRVL